MSDPATPAPEPVDPLVAFAQQVLAQSQAAGKLILAEAAAADADMQARTAELVNVMFRGKPPDGLFVEQDKNPAAESTPDKATTASAATEKPGQTTASAAAAPT
jgi:hypothetical protein